jgi:uncharacterized membrane protein
MPYCCKPATQERKLAKSAKTTMIVAVSLRRAGSFSTSGAIAATVVGAASVAAGWRWGALLLVYFAAATLLSHAGAAEKALRTRSIIAKAGARDAIQVVANGGMFAACALVAAHRGP